METPLPLLLMIFGVIQIMLSIALFLRRQKTRSWIHVKGTVVEVTTRKALKGSTWYHPSYRFNTLTGQTVVFRSIYGKATKEFIIGDSENIYYNPKDPMQARAGFARTSLAAIIILMVVGIGLLYFGFTYSF